MSADMDLELVIHGVRGSQAVAEHDCLGYGGNTTCLEVVLAPDWRVIVDCGSGLRHVAPSPDGVDARFEVLFTHYHWDHLLGLPFWPAVHTPHSRMNFYGPAAADRDVRAALEQAFHPPWFPVALAATACARRYARLPAEVLRFGALEVTHVPLCHPQGAVAYRFEGPRGVIVLATDHEGGDPEIDARLARFAQGADVLIHDAQYTPEEYERSRGWGHSTWRHAVEAAKAARVARLILFHHDPRHDDADVEAIVAAAAEVFPAVEAAREGQRLEL